MSPPHPKTPTPQSLLGKLLSTWFSCHDTEARAQAEQSTSGASFCLPPSVSSWPLAPALAAAVPAQAATLPFLEE